MTAAAAKREHFFLTVPREDFRAEIDFRAARRHSNVPRHAGAYVLQ